LRASPPGHPCTGSVALMNSLILRLSSTIVFKDGGAVVLQGPPFLNLKRRLQPMRIGTPSLTPCLANELKHSIRETDRHTQIRVTAEQPIEALRVLSEIG
jgi:hypothetical protein